MSNKGKIFTRADLPKNLRPELTEEQITAHIDAMTERNRIVAYLKDGTPLIAEELDERALQELSEDARPIATMVLRLSPAERLEVIRAFDDQGALIHPFTMV